MALWQSRVSTLAGLPVSSSTNAHQIFYRRLPCKSLMMLFDWVARSLRSTERTTLYFWDADGTTGLELKADSREEIGIASALAIYHLSIRPYTLRRASLALSLPLPCSPASTKCLRGALQTRRLTASCASSVPRWLIYNSSFPFSHCYGFFSRLKAFSTAVVSLILFVPSSFTSHTH